MKIRHTSDHSTRRAEAYPAIADQLDMLWHAMNNGTIPKAEPFYSEILKVKEKFPKRTD